jgi:hypothetical protein
MSMTFSFPLISPFGGTGGKRLALGLRLFASLMPAGACQQPKKNDSPAAPLWKAKKTKQRHKKLKTTYTFF